MNKSTLNTLRDPPQPSGKDTTVWSKSGPLSTVLKNAIESLLPIETRRGELAKAAMQQNFSSKLLKRHRVEQQILAPNTMETRGTTTQRLMALMQYNITQMASPFGYETSDLASRYARLAESHPEEDQRDQKKPNRRVRDIHPPRESATLPEGKKEQKSVGQQQQQQSLKDRQLEYIDNLIHIASTKQKIEGHEEPNRRARDMLPPLEEEKEPSMESTTLGETNWQKKQQRDSHIDIASIKQKIVRNDRMMCTIRRMEQYAHMPIDFQPKIYRHDYHWKLKKINSVDKFLPKKQLAEKMLLKDQKVPKKESQGKQSDYEHIPSQRTARVTKSPERAKKTKKLLKIGSNPEIRSKMFPTKRMKKQTPGPSTGRDL